MEEAPKNGTESSHSVPANGIEQNKIERDGLTNKNT
jgi:hypothetical protein